MSEHKGLGGTVLNIVLAGSAITLLGVGAVVLGLRASKHTKSHDEIAELPAPKGLPPGGAASGGGFLPAGRPDLVQPAVRPSMDFGARTGNAVAYDAEHERLWAVDEDAGALVALNPATLEIQKRIAVGKRPAQIVLDHAGRAFVTLRDEGAIAIVENDSVKKLSVGADPYGVALSPDHLTAYVVAGGSRRLVAIDTESLRERFRVPLAPMARGVATDGKVVVVAHAAGGFVSVVDIEAARKAERAEGDASGAVKQVALVPGDSGRRAGGAFAIVIDKEHDRAIIPHFSLDTGETRPHTERVFGTYGGGDPETSAPMQVVASGINLAGGARQATTRLPAPGPTADLAVQHIVFSGASLPRSAAFDDASRLLLVGDDGAHRLTVFDMGGSFVQARSVLSAPDGVRGMAISADGKTIWASASFARGLSRFEARAGAGGKGIFNATAVKTVSFGSDPRSAQVALGRKLFHDGADKRISAAGLACATCHPDGLRDNNVWTTDVGGRRTAMLAGRVKGSAPYHWRGERPNLQASFKATITRLGGTGLPRKESEALEAYLLDMPVPATDGGDANPDLVDEGQRIFMSAETNCSGCHQPGNGYRDGKLHDVGTFNSKDVEFEGKKAFDTPSLIGLEVGGPYYHDGSAATLEDVLKLANAGGRHMGDASHLDEHQRRALVAFLETL